jgi:PPOX class probable F420-dependent enzyme
MRLPEFQARQLLAAARVARLASVDQASRPHIVPVTFVLDGDRIYSAVDAKPKTTRSLQRLRNIRANPRVALLADHYDEDWTALWWVRADGHAQIVEEPRQMARPVELLTARYAQYRETPPTGPVIAVRVDRWSGWAGSAAASVTVET